MEIEGNERADAEAKDAATTPTASKAFQLPPLKSCRAQKIKTMAKEQWNKTWLTKTQAAHLNKARNQNGPKTIQQHSKPGYMRTSSMYNCKQDIAD
jgi:hypothetical protein